MLGRKKAAPVEQGRDRRQVQRSSSNSAFSYYNNRVPEVTDRRAVARADQADKGTRRQLLPRSLAQAPFWLLLAVAVLCLAKVLFLSTSPKVIILGNSAVAQTYLQPTSVYEAAARKLLTSSITSHSKLTVNLNGTAASLERQFPELQAVSLTVPLASSRPIVYVQVAQPSAVLQTAHGTYALNKSGLVLARLHTIPSGVPLVVDQSGATPKPGTRYLAGSMMDFMQTVSYQFTAAKIGINTFVLPPTSLYELDVRPEGASYIIKMNVQGDALVQSGAAIATVQQLGSSPPGEYLDVRTSGRVYYK